MGDVHRQRSSRPILFSIYVNDVLREPRVQLSLGFVMAFYNSKTNINYVVTTIQRQFDSLLNRPRTGRWGINASKNTAVLFSKRREPMEQCLRVSKTYLPSPIKRIKCLGLHSAFQLTLRAHAQTMHRKAAACLEQLFPVLVSSAMTRKICTTYVMPITTYVIPSGAIWPLC